MFGPHVNRTHAADTARPTLTAQVAAAVAAAASFPATAAAMFVAGPKERKLTLADDEAAELKAYLGETGITAVAHGTYLDVPWTGDPAAARFVIRELTTCQSAGIKGLVIHLPSEPVDLPQDGKDIKTSTATDKVVKLLPRCWSRTGVRLYLEMVAAAPARAAFNTPKKIQTLFAGIRKYVDPALKWTGLCIDTAHLWSGGINLSSYSDAKEWFDGLEAIAETIPSDRIMIHLNDSKYDCGDGRDEHEALMRGKIWKDYAAMPAKSGLAAVVEYAKKHNTIVILERKPSSLRASDYATLSLFT